MTKDILSVINAGETSTTEFKATFQKDVIETVVAFANANLRIMRTAAILTRWR